MKVALLLGLLLATNACDQGPAGAKTRGDNTGVNTRDREMDTLTPGDQGGSATDRAITPKIRQGVVKDEALSITAKNIKIITNDAIVTLRGPVNSEQERAEIGKIAERAEGVKRVDNQLEVVTK